MKKGFTLVELSIVLVIIGLLIGGILVAQSMIGTAKLQSQVRQIQQFDILVDNFRTKFNGIPGDSRLFATNGDGNGIIDSTGNGMVWDGESANFWKHLSDSGFSINGKTFTNTTTGGQITKDNIPETIFKNGGVSAGRNGNTNAYYMSGFFKGSNGGFNSFPNMSSPQGLLKPADALAIELKVDDGHGYNGRIRVDRYYVMAGPEPCRSFDVTVTDELCNLTIFFQ